MNQRIKVAVAGVGSCASALIQGVEYYSRNLNETVGLMYPDIGGYRLSDIEFVIGFDIDARKVGRTLREAIYSPPNCNMRVIPEDDFIGVISPGARVFKGPVLDGIAPHMRNLDHSITVITYGSLTLERVFENMTGNSDRSSHQVLGGVESVFVPLTMDLTTQTILL